MVATQGPWGRLAPSLVAMFMEANRLWPTRDTLSDGSLGDSAHANRVSDHNPKAPNPPGYVDALDLDYDQAAGADWFVHAENLRLRRDGRIKYVIFFGRVFRSYGSTAWQWTPYSGTNAHKAHMHVSVLASGRADTSPWFITAPEASDVTPDQDRILRELHTFLVTQLITEKGSNESAKWLDQRLKPIFDRLTALEAGSGGTTGTLHVEGDLTVT